jgi:hypothetical protein
LSKEKANLYYIASAMPGQVPEIDMKVLDGLHSWSRDAIVSLEKKYANLSLEDKEAVKLEAISLLAKRYKIFLMPKDNDRYRLFSEVLKMVKSGAFLGNCSIINNEKHIKSEFPSIFITVEGKDQLLKALDSLKNLPYEASGIEPKYAKKINNLVFCSSGGDVKEKDSFAVLGDRKVFEKDLIFFCGHSV